MDALQIDTVISRASRLARSTGRPAPRRRLPPHLACALILLALCGPWSPLQLGSWPLPSSLQGMFAVTAEEAPEGQAPSQQRGLSADTAYHGHGLDQINLFNGSLNLRLPLGGSYALGPRLSYGLSLAHNANSWEMERKVCFNPFANTLEEYGLPVPDPRANAGFGWRLELGTLRGQEYYGPDGGKRAFYPTLHPGKAGQAPYPATGEQPLTWFSNDGTYQRLREHVSGVCNSPQGFPAGRCRTLEMADGTVHEFLPFGMEDGELVWRVTRMRDRFGHHVDIDYGPETWTLSDSHGRSQVLRFAEGRLQRVELSAFAGQTAAYELQYETLNLRRQYFYAPACGNDGEWISVSVLRRVLLPDGSYYELGHHSSDAGGRLSGAIQSLRLPTGGELRWDYQAVDFSSQRPDVPEGDEHSSLAFAVRSKELRSHPAETEPVARWQYRYSTAGNPSLPGEEGETPCFHRVTVTDPMGHDTVHYFSTSARHRWAYGLPYTHCDPHADGAYMEEGPFLSQELYDGPAQEGRLQRSVWVEYGSDGNESGPFQDKNHRLRLRRVVFHDDGDHYREESYSDFDGMGNFRTRVLRGSFGPERRVLTDYAPERGTYRVIDPDRSMVDPASDFTMPGPDEPWLLGTYGSVQVLEGEHQELSQYCFDKQTGFPSRVRVLAGTEPGPHDLLTVRTPGEGSEAGFTVVEARYGGDGGQPLSTSGEDLCALALPDQAQALTEHRYLAGKKSWSAALEPSSGEPVLTLLDQDIDPGSGLVERSRDAAGVVTHKRYDLLGRLEAEGTDQSAWTYYEARLPTIYHPTRALALTVRACDTDRPLCQGVSGLKGWRRHLYDGLGRRLSEERRIPTDNGVELHTRYFQYNAAGWLEQESTWQDPQQVTRYEDYDRFGRPGKVTMPGQPPVSHQMRGVRFAAEGRFLRLDLGARELVWRREERDLQGRLVRVCEGASHAEQSCDGVMTRYSHDAGDRLITTCTERSDGSCVQERLFAYDGRGFLQAERHPELGLQGNGWRRYTYDARGNVLSDKVDGDSRFDRMHHYDAAGRLVQVEAHVGKRWQPIQEWIYGSDNVGQDQRLGKVVETRRYHWLAPERMTLGSAGQLRQATAVESFVYAGRDGRLSRRDTEVVVDGLRTQFSTGFTYDAMGQPATLDYPRCIAADFGCPTEQPYRQLSYEHVHGFPRKVFGYLDRLSYHPGGLLASVRHGNGVHWQQSLDPEAGLERPHRIVTTAGWDSGSYAYDGAGNIEQVGQQRYLYDALGRLRYGELSDGRSQTADYDHQGNLIRLRSAGLEHTAGIAQSSSQDRDLATDPSSNRLLGIDFRYDAAGNLVRQRTPGGVEMQATYDAGQSLLRLREEPGVERAFVYNAEGERILTLSCPTDGRCSALRVQATWTLRGLGSEVLRVFHQRGPGSWSWEEDYVYAASRPLVAVTPDGQGGESVYHLHSDHLGSPRQVTNEYGWEVARHEFYPFGAEATAASQTGFSLKFTGHERDQSPTDAEASLDYMHARYCSPYLGRFLSPDPVAGRPDRPQTWNRYAYARNNPLLFVDPDGRSEGAQFLLDNEVIEFLKTGEEPAYLDPSLQALGLLGATLITPGPDEVLAAAALRSLAHGSRGAGVLARGSVGARRSQQGAEAASDARRLEEGARDAQRARKQGASQQQMREVERNPEAVAGAGTKTSLRAADSLVERHGGHASDWARVRSSSHHAADGTRFEVQAYKNIKTGELVEVRTRMYRP